MALRRLALDRLWLLVTPGNPLKNHDGLPSLEARLAETRSIMTHPRIDVTGVEAALGSDMTVDTITALTARASLASLRLDHGRRQSRKLPPLASLAAARRSRADGRHRPSGSDASGLAFPRRAGALALPHPRISGPDARGTKPTRLGLLARASGRACPRPRSGRASSGAELAERRPLFWRRFRGRHVFGEMREAEEALRQKLHPFVAKRQLKRND